MKFCKGQGKVTKSGNLCSQRYLIVTPRQYVGNTCRTSCNLPVLYLYFNSLCMSDVQRFELTSQ